ncbi:MAG: 2,3-bisphosphoglycerate-independent phosphoglycerate mutase [Thermoplasmatota archaeon]
MRPGLLVILDGFGFGEPGHPCNAVELAKTPTLDRLVASCPMVEIDNNQHHVGLPEGQMGNSEVGHLNIGAGRVIYQDFLRINKAIEDGAFAQDEATQAAFARAKEGSGRLHLVGLLGPGGVHAHESHFGAALQAAAAAGVSEVFIHPITDGRDTDPRSAAGFLATLEAQIEAAGVGRIADLVGRYYAMDRDQRWERVEPAYRLFRQGDGLRSAPDAAAALAAAYEAGEDDEFVQATSIDPDGAIRDGDAVVWLNFRPDRSRQMTRAFKEPGFSAFDRGAEPSVFWVCTTQYDDRFLAYPDLAVAYPPARPTETLGEHVSGLGLTQFRVAETEKYAHVTYFLNGGREEPFPGEDRKLVPSPKVATYDLQPEMSAGEVTDAILEAMGTGGYDLIVVNYANGDMVGHTGNLEAGIQAIEFLDNCLDRITTTGTACGFVTLVTSDHGNCEEMCRVAEDGGRGDRLTAHSMLPSPLIAVNAGDGVGLEEGGALCNVAPTLLDLMGLPKPDAMSARSLVTRQAT